MPPIKPQRKGSKIDARRAEPCKPQSFVTYHAIPGAWQCHMHRNCACNEAIALANRVCQRTPECHPAIYRAGREMARRVATWLGRVPADHEGSWIQAYSGRKRTIYENARVEYQLNGLGKRGAILQSFVKLEKISDPSRDPRVIQARSPVFNYALGNYLKPMEHKLYRVSGTRNLRRFLPPGRLIAKCLDLHSRAEWVRRKMGRFANPVVYSIDCSRFDAHVNRHQLALEHLVYKSANPSSELASLLDKQYCNIGYTKRGVRYVCPAGRMSGDMNTALGNCLIMLIMCATAARMCGLTPQQFDLFIDGDDTLLFTDRSLESVLPEFVKIIEGFGHEVKLENRATEFERVVHCQAQPVITTSGPVMVQCPQRVVSRYLTSARNWNCGPARRSQYLNQLGTCALATFCGVPVLQEFARCLLRAGTPGPLRMTSGRIWQAARELNCNRAWSMDIDEHARQSFAAAFGISPSEQLMWEQYFARLDLAVGGNTSSWQ